MTKQTKNISSAAKYTKTQNHSTSTNMSKDVKKKGIAPADTDTTPGTKIQEQSEILKSLKPHKFMQNSEFTQLVCQQTELAQKALLLQEAGVISSVEVTTNISSTSFSLSVILNHYGDNEKKWCAEKLNYGENRELNTDATALEQLRSYIDEEIDKLNQRSKSFIERIGNLLSTFKK